MFIIVVITMYCGNLLYSLGEMKLVDIANIYVASLPCFPQTVLNGLQTLLHFMPRAVGYNQLQL